MISNMKSTLLLSLYKLNLTFSAYNARILNIKQLIDTIAKNITLI